MAGQPFPIETPKGHVGAAWHQGGRDAPALVVAHGAGAGMDHPFIEGFCDALSKEGVSALRFNFPYLEAGRRTPDAPANAIAAFRSAFDEASRRSGGPPVAAGGKSYGGRIASMAAAEGVPAAVLVFLGYPLHPPGKPNQVRDDHLYALRIPMLFLHGTKDPFAQAEILDGVIKKLGDRATYVPWEGAGHSFERSRKDDAAATGASLAPIVARFIEEHA
jgi:predicted alpha/beta-hydrolase family hydrolase